MGEIIEKLFKQYEEFWEKNKGKDAFDNFFDNFSEYAPKIEIGDFDDTVRNGLLFVSCNPSGADIEYYKEKNKNKEDVIWYKPEDGKDTSGFLGALKEFAGESVYSKLDVFCVVKKEQKEVRGHYKKHQEIYKEMFKIFVSTVEKLEPEIIVVANAFVRDLFQKDFIGKSGYEYEDKQDSDYGGHNAKFGNHDTYIFFTSMLSGGRALDVGSREVLKWAVERYKNRPK